MEHAAGDTAVGGHEVCGPKATADEGARYGAPAILTDLTEVREQARALELAQAQAQAQAQAVEAKREALERRRQLLRAESERMRSALASLKVSAIDRHSAAFQAPSNRLLIAFQSPSSLRVAFQPPSHRTALILPRQELDHASLGALPEEMLRG